MEYAAVSGGSLGEYIWDGDVGVEHADAYCGSHFVQSGNREWFCRMGVVLQCYRRVQCISAQSGGAY